MEDFYRPHFNILEKLEYLRYGWFINLLIGVCYVFLFYFEFSFHCIDFVFVYT